VNANPYAKPAPPDRLPPWSNEAEAGLLGCLLLGSAGTMDELDEAGASPAWFYERAHQVIYAACQELHKAGTYIDPVSVFLYLTQHNQVEAAGGAAYMASLPDATTSAINLPYYASVVEDKFRGRRLLQIAAEAVGSVYESQSSEDTDALLARVETEILKLSEEAAGEKERGAKQLINAVIDDLERYHRGGSKMKGLRTGLEYVDKMLEGLGGENGNMVVISGRPGTGKTSLALDIATFALLDHIEYTPKRDAQGQVIEENGKTVWEENKGVPVAIFSLEMSDTALVKRMLFQRARADMQRFRTGFAKESDFPPLTRASAELARAPLWIDDTGRCTIGALKAKARRLHRQHGIKLFIVDYIQLMRSDGRRFRDDRVQELAEISGEIQSLAKSLNVPFLVLAQMNRDYEKDPKRTPRLSDLKDCGAIEQDADVVGFLYEPKLGDEEEDQYNNAMEAKFGKDWSARPIRVNLLIAKYRYGPTGPCKLLFQRSCTHFMDWVRWLKDHGYKESAAGEKKSPQDIKDELPTNEELGV
jgi:replicative DNA helicase